MNILYVCDEYPPGMNGGIGTMVQVLGRELVRQGHQVTVIGLYPHYYGQKDYEVDCGVEVYRLRYGLNLGGKTRNFFYKAYEKLPDFIKSKINGHRAFDKFIQKVRQIIQEKNIQVMEIQDWNTFVFKIGFMVQWPAFEIPFIVKSNGSYSYFCDETRIQGKKKVKQIDRYLYQRADALSSVSYYTASVNKRLFNYSKEVTVLHNCIETDFDFKINLQKEEKTFIFTGTLIYKKGVFSLMEAWNKVIKKHPDAILKIYGKGDDGPMKERLTEESLKTVHFLGHTTRPQLFKELSKATGAIFPSYSECFALAPLEALAVGCPVISTSRASGTELITQGVNGSLIDPDNIDEIADKVIQLIESKDLQKKYSLAGRKKVEEFFNIEKSAKEHITYYQTVIHSFKHKI